MQNNIIINATLEQNQGINASLTDNNNFNAGSTQRGPQGIPGKDGEAATIVVGSTTTGLPGTDASVINSGTSSAAILDFRIPQGATGETGATGATGVSVTGVSLISTQGLQKTYRMTFSNNTYYDYIVTDGASGATVWGGISGTLSNQTDLQTELTGLQSQIDALVVSSDVFDIVGTYAELQAYNISTVPVNDIIKVLVDSTHLNAATYYRCVETGGVKSWSYIGSEGAYYTKSEADNLLNTKYDASNPEGYTSNIGTVTSVNNVQPDAQGNVTIQTGGLPSQSGHAGDVLTTDGTDASWADTTEVYPVIETYINGSSWYRIYAPDNTGYRWCEMGGLYYKGSTMAGTSNTINFLKTFKDLTYTFIPTPLHSSTALNQYQIYEEYTERTTSSTVLRIQSAIFGYAWTACGYIANEV